MSEFADRVRQVVAAIPAGKTKSYQEVAALAGNPKAARAVANVMARNFDPNIPCHRVIKSDGTMAGYNRGGSAVKAALLQQEKVTN